MYCCTYSVKLSVLLHILRCCAWTTTVWNLCCRVVMPLPLWPKYYTACKYCIWRKKKICSVCVTMFLSLVPRYDSKDGGLHGNQTVSCMAMWIHSQTDQKYPSTKMYMYPWAWTATTFMTCSIWFSAVCLCYSYNGIGSLVPLQLGRIPSLRALFLQGKPVLDLNSQVTSCDFFVIVMWPHVIFFW